MDDPINLKLMTYNIGGARQNLEEHFSASGILKVIGEEAPDILAAQEATEWCAPDGARFSQPEEISGSVLKGYHYFFGPTLSMRQDFHVQKKAFVRALFNDWKDWQQGNALFSRWDFVRLGNSALSGRPENVPISKTLYQGNRDTDPRYAILARINLGPAAVFVLATHLTTLNGERGDQAIPNKSQEAQAVRWMQCERILDLTRDFILKKKEALIIMGDFNAAASEPGILLALEKKGGLARLVPANNTPTHVRLKEPIDHILIYPGKYHIKYSCRVVEDNFTASDHNPVIARISLHDEHSEAFKEYGAGLFREAAQ